MSMTTATQPHIGLRPGVKREDFWDWDGKPYFVKCDPHTEIASIDPAFAACTACGHTWRTTGEPRPQRDAFPTPMDAGKAIYDWSRRQEAACDEAVPDRVCVTCRAASGRNDTQAETLPIWHLNVCHGCGAYICYPHTYWHGEEDSSTLCRSCRMERAKDGTLPKGSCIYGEGASRERP